MEINIKDCSIDILDPRMCILNEYISAVKEMLNAIKYIADANGHASMVVLAQRILSDVGNIDSIVKELTCDKNDGSIDEH